MILAHLTQTELPDLILLVGVGFIAGFGTAVARCVPGDGTS